MNCIKYGIFLLTLFFFFHCTKAQDTLRLDIQQADSIFVSNNFQILASFMNIEAEKAQIIKAKLYPNPIFTADLAAYNPNNKEVFPIGKTGQKLFQLEQLIILGGKRKVEIEMAKTNARISELEFEQLTRQLRFHLHSNLFALGQQQQLLFRYNEQLTLLDGLLSVYKIQVEKGNIPLKDLIRLKGAYLKLNNDRAELLKQYYDAQLTLQTLLSTSSLIVFDFSEESIEGYIKGNSLSELKELAVLNRQELQIMKEDKVLAEQFLEYQKKQVIPDINLFTSYDQSGGVFNNQINAGIAIPLPIWNRNQGDVKSSKYRVKEADYKMQAMEVELLSNIQNSYALYSQTVLEYQKTRVIYNEDFEITVQGMIDNFQKQNVSIIEFIGFFEAYNGVLTEITRIKTQLVVFGEQLNLLVGKNIY